MFHFLYFFCQFKTIRYLQRQEMYPYKEDAHQYVREKKNELDFSSQSFSVLLVS